MKSVILTIRLKWFYLTYKGIKTIEVRKSCPKNFVGDVYEVVSKTNFEKDLMEIPESEREFFRQFKGKVGLKFTLNKVGRIIKRYIPNDSYIYSSSGCVLTSDSCLTHEEIDDYIKAKVGETKGYAWHISNLVIFDEPKELSEFEKPKWNKCGIKDKNGLYQCHKCPYGEELNYGGVCHYQPLTRSPQSWCYVEGEDYEIH